jgi:hypothetical protein
VSMITEKHNQEKVSQEFSNSSFFKFTVSFWILFFYTHCCDPNSRYFSPFHYKVLCGFAENGWNFWFVEIWWSWSFDWNLRHCVTELLCYNCEFEWILRIHELVV